MVSRRNCDVMDGTASLETSPRLFRHTESSKHGLDLLSPFLFFVALRLGINGHDLCATLSLLPNV